MIDQPDTDFKEEEGDERIERHMEALMEENLELTKQNNKILRRMERNALIGFLAKMFLWVLLLGLPLLFLGPYLKPLYDLVRGGPNASQFQQLLDAYSGK